MCEIVETIALNPVPNCDLCPHHTLGNVLETALKTFRLNFLGGFEVEFMIMKTSSDGEMAPYSTGLGLMAVAGLRDPSFKYVEECIFELQESGVQLQSFHTEGRRGQYEFALRPLPPMEAVDQLILVHDTIKRTFALRWYVLSS
jgi:glutamine synthetase